MLAAQRLPEELPLVASAAQTESKVLEYSLTVGMSVMEGRGFYYPADTLPTSHGACTSSTGRSTASNGAFG